MTLVEILDGLPDTDRRALRLRLDAFASQSGLARLVVGNLFLETRLGDTAWQDIVASLLAAPPDPGSLSTALTNGCRRHVLGGGGIEPPWPVCLGRAVTLEAFCQHLHARGYAHTIEQARWWAYRLARGSLDDARRWLGRKLLGRHVMWATFDPDDGTRDPFPALGFAADTIRARLGLPRDDRRKALLLLTYVLPSGASPCFPTVADAGASDVWLWHFRPAPPTERHGWTMPWDPALEPTPEVVHAPVTGAGLNTPLRVLR